MLGDIKSLGKETLIYGLSTVVARLLNFLLLPLYTHCLHTGEYGVVATAFSYLAFFNIFYQYGMDQAYLRHASDPQGESPQALFSTPFWCLLATALAFSACLHLWAEPLARLGNLADKQAGVVRYHPELVRYSAWILALDALTIVPFAELRLRHRAWTFVSIRVFNIALNLALNFYFLAVLPLGMRGVFLASLITSAATFAALTPVLAKNLRGLFRSGLLAELLRFGLPLIPAGLGSMAVQVIDRPILMKLTDPETVGIYQANYRLGIFMMLVVGMFDQAWRPFFLERAHRPDSGRIFGRVLTYFLAAGIWIVLTLSLFIGDIVRLPVFGRPLIHPAYWPGLGVVPVVLVSYLLNGSYINFIASVTLAKRTELLAAVTLLGAAVNIAANFLLIPTMGMMGAAWATLAAYLAMAVSLYLIGRKVYPIPYEYGRLVHLGLAALAVLAAARWAQGLKTDTAAYAAARLGILALWPILLFVTGFFTRGEKEALRALRSPI